MKRWIIILIVSIISIAFLVIAQTSSERLKNNKRVIENEIANTQKLLNQIRKNQKTSLNEIQLLRQQINNREVLITELNNELYQYEMELELNIKLSRDLDKKLEYMKTDYERVVYLAYKNRKMIDRLTFLLSADDFSQMFRRARYYAIFSESVKYQVDLIKKIQAEITKKNAEITILREQKQAVLEGKELEVKRLEQDRNSKTKTAEQLKKKEKALASELRDKQKRRRELDAAIKKAIEEEIKAANKKKNSAKTNTKSRTGTTTPSKGSKSSTVIELTPEEQLVSNSFINNKGKLPWPVVKGSKISDFGTAPHPDVPSVMIENRGIDILVEPGTHVRAIFEGIVSGVLEMMGSKVVMVRHGEYLTVYQNLATVNVKKGDKVTTKQVLGTVGKSSGSNSYELHFEVWKNTSFLNPNSWLSNK
ncbi:MAG TPA: peptidoglycan DD-metalloendopeptidase family protein [Bacteroidales bacterium]|nr:peptidoglycan DD-metalloendopeptidase family protein [Bacteroidales bacterium]